MLLGNKENREKKNREKKRKKKCRYVYFLSYKVTNQNIYSLKLMDKKWTFKNV